ncbi:MarR family winged helix-turn-helix transcriptional regulator [Cryobacterium sp. MLB-32]|uniref:MarR family winged helix-turn-helix transcriptional regulator n=1 Tax=Cryobacterium sp. MLB-32 TaxID=1529318 RepID=UPI001E2EE1D6|nr:MarR family transcriptional regulator [Cryobacterium sp. MLB-32]
MAIVGRLSKLTRLFERSLQDVFLRHDLQPGEFDLLATLRRNGSGTGTQGLTAGELAANAMVTSGAITNRLDRLVAKALVSREPDPLSRRTIRVVLTDRGQAVVDQTLIEHVANEEQLLSSLSLDQREKLEAMLRELLRAHEPRS